MGNAESAQISKSDSLRRIFQRYLEEFKTSGTHSGNPSTGKDCPGFPGLKCDPLISHCPYSPFGEADCSPCDSTCNPEKLVSADRIVDCLQQCQAYLLNELGLLNENSEDNFVAVVVLSVFVGLLILGIICCVIIRIRRWKNAQTTAGRRQVPQESNQEQEQGPLGNGLIETARPVPAIPTQENNGHAMEMADLAPQR